jgi:hypothetical protein
MMRGGLSYDLIKYKIIPNITDPFDLLEVSHVCRDWRGWVHLMKRKCPNPDCEDTTCPYGEFKVFLRILNIIAGIEEIDYSNLYHKCLVYQLRFILFPYKKRFTLSYRLPNYQENDRRYIDGYGYAPPSTFPSVGMHEYSIFFLYFGLIMSRGTIDQNRNKLWKLDTIDSLNIMRNISDLLCDNHKDEYLKIICISGIWECDKKGFVELKKN